MKHDSASSSTAGSETASEKGGRIPTFREEEAVAMLLAGASFAEAMQATGLAFERITTLWRERTGIAAQQIS